MKTHVYGASLSTKYAQELNLDVVEVLKSSIKDLGITRYRLMTYWDECEAKQGAVDFSSVEQLIAIIEAAGGEVTLCVGIRQPRWPECHQPEWAKKLGQQERKAALLNYLSATINHFKGRSVITSYQLENEALNRSFGNCSNYDRSRLRQEYELVRELDPDTPIVMTTSNSWGVPVRRPRPNMVGFSLYLHQYTNGKQTNRYFPPWVHRLRSWFARKAFCHELQMEPWGNRATSELSDDEQLALMGVDDIAASFSYAQATGLKTIDLWGLEWWYWRKTQRNDDSAWQMVKKYTAELGQR